MRVLATPRLRRASWPRLTLRSLIDRLVAADAAYRDAERLSRLDDYLLRDMGLTRDAVRQPPHRR